MRSVIPASIAGVTRKSRHAKVNRAWDFEANHSDAGGRSLLVHHPNFYPNARGSATLVAAEAALSLCVLKYPCSSVVKKFAYAWLWTKSGLLH